MESTEPCNRETSVVLRLLTLFGGGKAMLLCHSRRNGTGRQSSRMTGKYSRYGSNQQKRMFIYGRLDYKPNNCLTRPLRVCLDACSGLAFCFPFLAVRGQKLWVVAAAV